MSKENKADRDIEVYFDEAKNETLVKARGRQPVGLDDLGYMYDVYCGGQKNWINSGGYIDYFETPRGYEFEIQYESGYQGAIDETLAVELIGKLARGF